MYKTLQFKNLKTRRVMNAKVSVFVIFVAMIIYFLLFNLHECILLLERFDILKLLEYYCRQSWLKLAESATNMTLMLFRLFYKYMLFLELSLLLVTNFFSYSNILVLIRALKASELQSNKKPSLLKPIFKSSHLIQIDPHKKCKHFWRHQYKLIFRDICFLVIMIYICI